MSQNIKRNAEPEDLSLIIRSDWSVGPRTAAWDRLWRFVLGSLDAHPSTTPSPGQEEVGNA